MAKQAVHVEGVYKLIRLVVSDLADIVMPARYAGEDKAQIKTQKFIC